MRKEKFIPKMGDLLSIPDDVVAGSESIMGAFQSVLDVAIKSKLDPEKLNVACDSFLFLQSKLEVSSFQAILMALLIDHVLPLQAPQIASALGTNNIRVLSLMPEMDELIDRRLVRKRTDRMNHAVVYELRSEVLRSYMQNKVYVSESNSRLTLSRLFSRLGELYDQCENDELDVEELQMEVADIIAKNQRLEVCKLMNRRDSTDQVLFMFLCTCFVLEGDVKVCSMQFRNFFSGLRFRSICTQLANGKHPLIGDGLVEYGADGGFSSRDGVTVSEEIRKKLTVELNLDWSTCRLDEEKRGLLLCEDIQLKRLFYNASEEKAVARLSDLLQESNYQGIRERLSESGMRKGFACLFYGAPGTGKTETVLQLAKASGRDVMAVNISQVKSKWVGDTEKNIKEIFDRYRTCCAHRKVAPILLFNEADAIISNRTSAAKSSVDKMENAMQNIILEEMEKLDGILIATTNLTSNMDPAFERRFIYKVEFCQPAPSVKVSIWQSMLKELPREDAEILSRKYDFSGGQIENIVRKQVIDGILYNKSLNLENLDEYCRMELIHKENPRRAIVGFK